MATVIRAARIVEARMVLPAPGQPVAVPGGPAAQQPGGAVAGGAPADPFAAARAELALREQRLAEREQALAQDLDEARRTAAAQGYQEGNARGQADALGAQRERLDALERVLAGLHEQFGEQVASLEDVMVGIAFEAVCKIIGETMHGVDGVRAVVRAVVARVRAEEHLVVHLSPHDYQLLREARGAASGASDGEPHVLAPDHRVALGGCMVETTGGTVDGRLETQLQKLRDTLSAARKAAPGQA